MITDVMLHANSNHFKAELASRLKRMCIFHVVIKGNPGCPGTMSYVMVWLESMPRIKAAVLIIRTLVLEDWQWLVVCTVQASKKQAIDEVED